MTQLRRALETVDRAVGLLEARVAKTGNSRDQELLGRLVAARTVIAKAAVRANDVDALSILTPSERRPFTGAESNPANPYIGAPMKDSLVKKAKKLKRKSPNASTADILYGLAEDAPDPTQREALGVAGTANVIKALRKRAGLR